MKRILHIVQILEYCDTPEIFIASDRVGTKYLCLYVDDEDDKINYIATQLSSKRLAEFINGYVDLRHIYEYPEIKEWYYFNDSLDNIEAFLWEEEYLPEHYLPDQVYIYHKAKKKG